MRSQTTDTQTALLLLRKHDDCSGSVLDQRRYAQAAMLAKITQLSCSTEAVVNQRAAKSGIISFARGAFCLICLVFYTVLYAANAAAQQSDNNTEATNKQANSNLGRPLIDNTGKKVTPNYQITLPKDHGEHPEYDIEWWYLTANLRDENKKAYTVQWTLFRFRTPHRANNWDNGQVYMAHSSIHAQDKHYFSERFAKGGVCNAGVNTVAAQNATTNKPLLSLYMDDWLWQSTAPMKDQDGSDQPVALSMMTSAAEADKHPSLFPSRLSFSAVEVLKHKNVSSSEHSKPGSASAILNLNSDAEFIFHGNNGYSIKSGNAQHASYYYSQPFIDVEGVISIHNSTPANVLKADTEHADTNSKDIKVSGKAWFDHEWTSQLIDDQTRGWDWFSIHLQNGDKLMAFVMRLEGQDDYMTGTYIDAQGKVKVLLPEDLSMTVLKTTHVDNKHIPTKWQIKVPSRELDITTEVTKNEQFNPSRFEYYEGSIDVTGSHTGVGFMELTGY